MPVGNVTDEEFGVIKAEGIGDPMQFMGIFDAATRNLGQPGGSVPPEFVRSQVDRLADTFMRRVIEKTGRPPTQSQVREFLGANITPGLAEQAILQGGVGIGQAQMQSQVVDPFIQAKGEEFTPTAPTVTPTADPGEELQRKFNEIFGRIEEAGLSRVEREFNRAQRELAEQEAQLGRIRSGVARRPRAELAGEEARARIEAVAPLLQQRAAGEVGLAQTLANLMQTERESRRRGQQFFAGLGEQRRRALAGETLGRQRIGLERELGIGGLQEAIRRRQGKAPTTMEQIRSGVGLARDVAETLGAFKKLRE